MKKREGEVKVWEEERETYKKKIMKEEEKLEEEKESERLSQVYLRK